MNQETPQSASGSRWQDLRTRVIAALIWAPVAFGGIYFGPPFADMVVLGVTLVMALEVSAIMTPGSNIQRGFFIAQFLLIAGAVAYQMPWFVFVWAGVSMLICFLTTCASRWRGILFPALASIYIGVPMGLLLVIRGLPDGLIWTLMLFINNWGTDIFALVGGRLFGKTPLAPHISPNKTWEGAVTGVVVGSTAGFLIALLAGFPIGLAIVANLVVGVLVPAGDLLESWLKRLFDVKDTGFLIPGHGGFVDRLDGTLLAAPALYAVLSML